MTEVTAPAREYMPAKSISWKWHTATQEDAREATIYYNGSPRGRMGRNADGDWTGYITSRLQRRDGVILTIQAEVVDGYPDMDSCAKNLWHHFRRSATRQGLFWK